AATRDALAVEVTRLRETTAGLAEVCHERQGTLDRLSARLAEHRGQAAKAQAELAQLQTRHSGTSERAAGLEELEKRLEGLSAGVKQLLAEAQSATGGPLKQIRGLVADLLQVSFENAPLVELALGDLAQCLVVADGHQWTAHLQSAAQLEGR